MNEKIQLAHGDGGQLTHQLIQQLFVKEFESESIFDSAFLNVPKQKLAMTTDSFVVKPIFFPGGNIGKLAVAGTVNDLAVSGAKPLFLSCAFIIEEGFLISDLKKIVKSMVEEAKKSNVSIVCGDTKVVEHGAADGIFINTTGIGTIDYECEANTITVGDSIILSGTMGDHGMAVLLARGELGIESPIQSDCASLYMMIKEVLNNCSSVRIMRDPTRGGVATTLVEICEDFHVTMVIDERKLPVKNEVHGPCELIGFDPLYIANEGKVIFIVPKQEEVRVLAILQQFEEGKDCTVIGSVTDIEKGKLLLKTPIGSTRRLTRLAGLQLPRIC